MAGSGPSTSSAAVFDMTHLWSVVSDTAGAWLPASTSNHADLSAPTSAQHPKRQKPNSNFVEYFNIKMYALSLLSASDSATNPAPAYAFDIPLLPS